MDGHSRPEPLQANVRVRAVAKTSSDPLRAGPPGPCAAGSLYRYRPDEACLVALRKADLRDTLVRSCLGQDKAGACAVAFFVVANLRHAIESLGERGYRDLLIEAGGIGQRIYLAAEAAGLSARNLAAFRDDDLNRLLALDGRERAILHLILAGREA